MRTIDVKVERWPIAGAFTISRGSRTEAVVVVVTITQGGLIGAGECVPYARYGESVESVVEQIASITDELRGGMTRKTLLVALPAGAARNAIDCALWDLEAKQAKVPLHRLANMPAPQKILTAYTLSLGAPDAMFDSAKKAANRPLLKIKLGADGDPERLAAVREGAPKARLIVDANEAWRVDTLRANLAACEAVGVELIEQPLPAGDDKALATTATDIVLCADESLHDHASLAHLSPWYGAINIKLDKTGGLTDALDLSRAARANGLQLMIGCMLGTSLAMRPALILAEGAEFVDLDGPLLLAKDREPGLRFDGSYILPT